MKKIFITILMLLSINLYADNMEMIDTNGTHYNIVAEGNSMKVEGMDGKVVFIQFFGLKCPACKQEIPHLINIQKKYPNKLKILAIEVQKNDNDPINTFKEKHGINYTTFSNFDVGFVARYIIEKSGWKGAIPFMVAIDSKGQVQFTQAGIIDEKKLEEYVEKFSK
jgi:thiol-disulfide isomerase/thioredoxin